MSKERPGLYLMIFILLMRSCGTSYDVRDIKQKVESLQCTVPDAGVSPDA